MNWAWSSSRNSTQRKWTRSNRVFRKIPFSSSWDHQASLHSQTTSSFSQSFQHQGKLLTFGIKNQAQCLGARLKGFLSNIQWMSSFNSTNLTTLQCWIEATLLLFETCLLFGSCHFHKYKSCVLFGSIDFYNEPWVLFGLCWVLCEPCVDKIPNSKQGSVY